MRKNKIIQIKNLIKDALFYLKLKLFSPESNNSNTVRVELEFPQLYHRYFYNLIKTLRIGGYQIYYPMDFKTFRNLRNGDNYIALLFKEKGLIFINGDQTNKKHIVLKDEMFSPDYYKTYFVDDNIEGDNYHVPMSFHPYMYSKNLWNKTIFENDPLRINSVFCFGNFNQDAYKQVHNSKFEIIDRASLLDYFLAKPNSISVQSKKHLKEIIDHKIDGKVIFCKKNNYQIPMPDVRFYLSKFRYYLCCPGVFAPLSHNFIESVSAGCIPIIQRSYADTIYPPLQHLENALIFDDYKDLERIMNTVLVHISDEKYLMMKNNIQQYYQNHLHPKSVANTIIENLNNGIIYINASERSINFHKKMAS